MGFLVVFSLVVGLAALGVAALRSAESPPAAGAPFHVTSVRPHGPLGSRKGAARSSKLTSWPGLP